MPAADVWQVSWKLVHATKNVPTVFQALDTKRTKLNQKQISGLALRLIVHPFSPFTCSLSVVLWR